jgi:hypothetical protein
VASPADAADADLVLGGRLRSTEFDVYLTSYALGAPGVLLWWLNLPIGSDDATVKIDLSLRTRDGQEVWSFPLKARASHLFTLYSSDAGISGLSSRFRVEIKRYGSNDLGIDGDSLWAFHAEALRAGMEPAKASLREWLVRSGELKP